MVIETFSGSNTNSTSSHLGLLVKPLLCCVIVNYAKAKQRSQAGQQEDQIRKCRPEASRDKVTESFGVLTFEGCIVEFGHIFLQLL